MFQKRASTFGFTLVELLLVLAIVAGAALWIIPNFHRYQVRHALELAAAQAQQMMARAQLLAQSESDAGWTADIEQGVLYRGTDFASRDPSLDEYYSMPDLVSVVQGSAVSFSSLYGEPSLSGAVVLQNTFGEQKTIPVPQALGGPRSITYTNTVRMKIDFQHIQNNGGGSAEAASYVGLGGTRYGDGEWIPLKTDATSFTDTGLLIGALGLAVERRPNQVVILSYGGLDPGGKEVVDALITIEGASITNVENNIGDNETENPFDGQENNGVGGDEVTIQDEYTVLFQTRVTNAGDSIIITWEEDPPWWVR